jgi:hypothetical protein
MKWTRTVSNESGKSSLIEAETDDSDNGMDRFKQIWQRIRPKTEGKSKEELIISDSRAAKRDCKGKKNRKIVGWKKRRRNELVTNRSRMT